MPAERARPRLSGALSVLLALLLSLAAHAGDFRVEAGIAFGLMAAALLTTLLAAKLSRKG